MAENVGVATASMKLYANSNDKDFGEIINQAIDIHTKKAIQGLEFDKTENAEIVDISNAASGDYVVFNGSTRYHAYSNDTGYTLGTKVCILIPNSDYAQQKLILNKVRRSSSDTIVNLSWPLDEYESETPDLFEVDEKGQYIYGADDIDIDFLNEIFSKNPSKNYYYKDEDQLFYYKKTDLTTGEEKEYGPIYEGSLSRIAYGYKRIGEEDTNEKIALTHLEENYNNEIGAGIVANGSNIIENGTTIKEYPEYTLLFMSKDLTILNNPETGESLFNRNSRRMGLRAYFKSNIDVYKNIASDSEYALDIIVLYSVQILGNFDRTYALKSYRLSSKKMIGNVFYLTNSSRQEALFDLYQDDKNDLKIHRIGVLLYQNGEFQRNGENGLYYITPEKQKDKEEYVKNIFVSDISLTLGNAKIDRDIDEISLYSTSGAMYDSTAKRDADISKKIQLKWVHKNPDGEKKAITSLNDCGTSGAEPTVTWFRDYIEDIENYKVDTKEEIERYSYLQSILDLYDESYPNYYNWITKWIEIQKQYPEKDQNVLWAEMWTGLEAELSEEEKAEREKNRAKLNKLLPDLIAAFDIKEKEYSYDEVNKTITFGERGISKIRKGISEASTEYKKALKNSDKGGQGWVPIESEDKNTMSIKFVPDRKVNQCSVKCVIEYGPKIYKQDLDIEEEDREIYDTTSPYYTKIETEPITFYNQNALPDAATLDASIGLEFKFEDGSKGNYPIYDYSGRLFEPQNAAIVRKLSVDLKSKKKGVSYINGNEKIIWKFPKSNSSQRSTMINFSSSMEDDPDFLIPEEKITTQFTVRTVDHDPTRKENYSKGDKVFCYIHTENNTEYIVRDKQDDDIIRYYICLQDYQETDNNLITPLNNAEYWKEYNLISEFKVVYPNHQTTRLDSNNYIFTEYAEDIPYDDDYYYIMCEALSKNTSFYRAVYDTNGNFAKCQFVVPNAYEAELAKQDNSIDGIEIVQDYDSCIPIPARNYFKYQIKEVFSPSIVSNNKITCYLIKNNIVFKGSTTLFFGNKGNNGTDYTINFGLSDLVDPISGPIIDEYITENSNNKGIINSNNIYETNEWKEVQMPTGVLTLGETGFHKIVFSVLDPDGEQMNLTNKQKNDIINLWINGEDEGYYSGQANYDNLSFLCKYVEEDNIKYYTDVAVRANTNITDVKDLNFLALQLKIDTINPETNETDNSNNITVTSSGRTHDLTNINLSAVLPLNVRENNEYQMAGSNFIYYSDTGQLINQGYTEYSLNDITRQPEYENYLENFESLKKKLDEIERKEKGKTEKQLLYAELEKIYKAVNHDNITDAELVETINDHFPLLSESIGKISLKADGYHVEGDLKEIKKNLYKHLKEWIRIYNSFIVLQTPKIEEDENLSTLEVFQNNPLGLKESGVWTESAYDLVKNKLIEFGAIYNEDPKKGLISSNNKQKVKKAVDNAMSKNKSNWKKKQNEYKNKYGKEIQAENDAYKKWKNGYDKIIKNAESTCTKRWNKCLYNAEVYSTKLDPISNSKKGFSENVMNSILSIFDTTDPIQRNISNIIRTGGFSKKYTFFDYETSDTNEKNIRKKDLVTLQESLAYVEELENNFEKLIKESNFTLDSSKSTNYINYLKRSLSAIKTYKSLQMEKIKLLYGYSENDNEIKLYLKDENNNFVFENSDKEIAFNATNAADIFNYPESDPDFNSDDPDSLGSKFDFSHACLKNQIVAAKNIFEILNQKKFDNLPKLENLDEWKNDKAKYEQEEILLQYCLYLLQTNGIIPEASLFSLTDFLEALSTYIEKLAEINGDTLTKIDSKYQLEENSENSGLLNIFSKMYDIYAKKEEERQEHYKVIIQILDTDLSHFNPNDPEAINTFGEYVDAYIEPKKPIEPTYPEESENLTGLALEQALEEYEINKKEYDEEKAVYDEYERVCSYYPSFKDEERKLTVSPICIDGLIKEVAINCVIKNKPIYTMPLIIIKNSSAIPVVEKWNNKATKDDEGNSIYSAVLSAGSINNNNQYSGVIVGAIGGSADASQYTDQNKNAINGIYGYHEGVQSFGILTDGTSFLGKPGTGRIEFDGNRGIIKSASYIENGNNGTCIDLKEGDIDLRNATKNIHIHLGSKYVDYENDEDDGNYFNITVPSTAKKKKENAEEGEELLEDIGGENSLINIGEGSYYLQTADYAENSVSGLRIDLTDGSFSSKGKFDLKAAEGSTIEFGDSISRNEAYFKILNTGEIVCRGITIYGIGNSGEEQQEAFSASGKAAQATYADQWTNERDFHIESSPNKNINEPNKNYIGSSVEVNGSEDITLKLPAIIKADLEGNASSATQWESKKTFKIQDSATTPHNGQEIEIDGSEEEDIILKLPTTIKADLEGNASTATTASKITTTVNGAAVNLIPQQKTVVTNVEIVTTSTDPNDILIDETHYMHLTTENIWVLKQE